MQMPLANRLGNVAASPAPDIMKGQTKAETVPSRQKHEELHFEEGRSVAFGKDTTSYFGRQRGPGSQETRIRACSVIMNNRFLSLGLHQPVCETRTSGQEWN